MELIKTISKETTWSNGTIPLIKEIRAIGFDSKSNSLYLADYFGQSIKVINLETNQVKEIYKGKGLVLNFLKIEPRSKNSLRIFLILENEEDYDAGAGKIGIILANETKNSLLEEIDLKETEEYVLLIKSSAIFELNNGNFIWAIDQMEYIHEFEIKDSINTRTISFIHKRKLPLPLCGFIKLDIDNKNLIAVTFEDGSLRILEVLPFHLNEIFSIENGPNCYNLSYLQENQIILAHLSNKSTKQTIQQFSIIANSKIKISKLNEFGISDSSNISCWAVSNQKNQQNENYKILYAVQEESQSILILKLN